MSFAEEKWRSKPKIFWDNFSGEVFDTRKIIPFKPFLHGAAVFGGH